MRASCLSRPVALRRTLSTPVSPFSRPGRPFACSTLPSSRNTTSCRALVAPCRAVLSQATAAPSSRPVGPSVRSIPPSGRRAVPFSCLLDPRHPLFTHGEASSRPDTPFCFVRAPSAPSTALSAALHAMFATLSNAVRCPPPAPRSLRLSRAIPALRRPPSPSVALSRPSPPSAHCTRPLRAVRAVPTPSAALHASFTRRMRPPPPSTALRRLTHAPARFSNGLSHPCDRVMRLWRLIIAALSPSRPSDASMTCPAPYQRTPQPSRRPVHPSNDVAGMSQDAARLSNGTDAFAHSCRLALPCACRCSSHCLMLTVPPCHHFTPPCPCFTAARPSNGASQHSRMPSCGAACPHAPPLADHRAVRAPAALCIPETMQQTRLGMLRALATACRGAPVVTTSRAHPPSSTPLQWHKTGIARALNAPLTLATQHSHPSNAPFGLERG
ncbi:hypothetical protein DENSPDRAFT_885480 [Dentipellis sp. KUC8613]|nr:hypothetical protein DENSPDRAFT_885480 [Dentipellis sp. KUC8613]